MKAREVAQSLEAKGFKAERDRDHIYYFFWHNLKRTGISTKISHNEKDLTDQLCAFMARQTKLTLSQFKKLIDCPMTEQMYIDHLFQTSNLKKPPQNAVVSAPPAVRHKK